MRSRYPAGVLNDIWLELSSRLEDLPAPGLESHRRPVSRLIRSRAPHGEVQAVDDDVLHRLGAQQVEEIQLDTTDADCRLLGRAEQGVSNKSGRGYCV